MIEKINKKISSKKAEIRRLEKEIAQLEIELSYERKKWSDEIITAPIKRVGILDDLIDND